MSEAIKTSTLVESQLPAFLEDESLLPEFVKAYYEFVEQSGQFGFDGYEFETLHNIDLTADQFLKYFTEELMPTLPSTIASDKRIAAKNIKELYQAKGSEKAYKLLFKLLYGEDVEVYLPGQDVLRASAGRWQQETVLRVGDPKVGDLTELLNTKVVGKTSGATALVENITNTIVSGIYSSELRVSNILGTFAAGELLCSEDGTIEATVSSTSIGGISGLTITNTGKNFQLGDSVTISDATGAGTGATGIVIDVADTATEPTGIDFTITDGGTGYRVGSLVTVSGGDGSGGSFTVTAIDSTENLFLRTDIIDPVANVPIGTNPFGATGVTSSALISNTFLASNSSTTLGTALAGDFFTVGTISAIEVTDFGSDYLNTLPNVEVEDVFVSVQRVPETVDPIGGFKGDNAVITPTLLTGGLIELSITDPGTSYSQFTKVSIEDSNGNIAEGFPVISTTVTPRGKYLSTDGFLSWDKKLEDNFYYQQYSYVIRSKQFVKNYKNLVRSTVHPAGTKMFGEVQLYDGGTGIKSGATIDHHLEVTEINANLIFETIYDKLTGSVYVSNNANVSYYGANAIFKLDNIAVGNVGTPFLVWGNNTLFTTELANNEEIALLSPAGEQFLGRARIIDSNTTILLDLPYTANTLSNGSIYKV